LGEGDSTRERVKAESRVKRSSCEVRESVIATQSERERDREVGVTNEKGGKRKRRGREVRGTGTSAINMILNWGERLRSDQMWLGSVMYRVATQNFKCHIFNSLSINFKYRYIVSYYY
jgi:hypothetical protein